MLTDDLARQAARFPDKCALAMAGGGAAITYAALNDQASRLAAVLIALGLNPGDAFALMLENNLDAPAFWWAGQRIGCYYIPLSPRMTSAEAATILCSGGAKLLILGQSAAADAANLAARCQNLRIFTLADLAVRRAAATPLTEAAPLIGRELIFSSGTTGTPKGVQRPLVVRTENPALPPLEMEIRRLFDVAEDMIYLATAPLHHATGRFLNRVIAAGGTTVIMPKFDPEGALHAIAQHGVTHSQWVPTMFSRLLALAPEIRARYSLSTHRLALHAGAPCPEPVKRAMLAWWGPILREYYGGTENVGVTRIDSDEWLTHPGSVGRPVLGAVKILSDDGSFRELPQGDIGVIHFSGGIPFVYHTEGVSTSAALDATGWGTYGDLGKLDADGYLYISDRRTDLILCGGVNVYPAEIEKILETCAHVAEVAVVAKPHPDLGQVPVAFIVPAREGVREEDIIAFTRHRLSGIKLPRAIYFVDELPRTESGKVRKLELRARL